MESFDQSLKYVHIEFHRRHQNLEDLAIDVAEAQVRMFRRERVPVCSLVWDLYGKPEEPVLEPRTLAGAERLPLEMVKSLISEGRLMESELYRSLFEEVEAKGKRETIIGILMRRLGALDVAIREKIRAASDREVLNTWYDEVLGVVDAEGARRLAAAIQNAPLEQTSR